MLGKSLQAAVAGQAAGATYVEDVFSTYLYNGTDTSTSHQIVNGIDLAGEGGLVWIKKRDSNIANTNHYLSDTERGNYYLASNSTNAQASGDIASYNSDGWTFNASTGLGTDYLAAQSYVSWTFRKAPKFFDVVTWTGDGTDPRTISHNLGSVPGFIIVKRTDDVDDWIVYHRSVTNGYLKLNTKDATLTRTDYIYQNPTSTTFQVGGSANVNGSGATYVAYLFAHNAGGFGDSGEENVISCGSYIGGGASPVEVDLGFQPQWVLVKNTTINTYDWFIVDEMRGMTVNDEEWGLNPNTSDQERSPDVLSPTATGFLTGTAIDTNNSGDTYIYIAIRRPMKTPTSGTEVFQPVAYTSTNVDQRLVETGIVTDMVMVRARNVVSSLGFVIGDRLRSDYFLGTVPTSAEAADTDSFDQLSTGNPFSVQNGFVVGNDATRLLNYSTNTEIAYAFKRAPGFFDVVCYTGDATARTINHNLGVAPELIIVKRRDNISFWSAYAAQIGATKYLVINTASAESTSSAWWNDTEPTSTVFSLGTATAVNNSGATYVAYLFASCPGVSKLGSYTGTGTTKQIDCGFSAGARFVLIKRTDATGAWYVWDSARGIVSGNDPYLLLNLTDAEVTSTDYIDPLASGFEISSTAPAAINASGGTYIYLAIS